jgi:hypothetical protein
MDVEGKWERKEEIILVSSILLSYVTFLLCCFNGIRKN